MLNPIKEANKLLNRLGIEAIPTPVEKIAGLLGAKIVRQSSDDDLSGMIYLNSTGIVIGVNESHHENRQRFTIAHELGHLVMHAQVLKGSVHIDKKFGIQFNRDKRSSLGEDLLEIQANKFAAELLMPTERIKKEIKNAYIDIEDDEQIMALAKKYGVSSQAMSIKLFETFSSDFSFSK